MQILPTILCTMGTTLKDTGNAMAKLSAKREGHIPRVATDTPPDMSVRHSDIVIDMKNDMKRQNNTVRYLTGIRISFVTKAPINTFSKKEGEMVM